MPDQMAALTIPLRVLIVEDSRDDALLLLRTLRAGGYEPAHRLVASPGALAMALDHQTWDLILCDFTMLGFDGMEALALVRSRGLDIPFIYVSGTIGEETAAAAMLAGAQDYVLKNQPKRLIPTIERELREARMRHAGVRSEAGRLTAEARFREVLAMAPDAIVAVDDRQRITIFNHAAEALFGYAAEEVVGRPLDLLLPARLAAAHRGHVTGFAHSEVGSRRMQERGEVFGRRKNGEEFPAEASISRMVENGQATFMAIVHDVTERKQLEAQLRRSQKLEAVGQLTGGLAHDFNNLLTVVIGTLELLQETPDGSAQTHELVGQALEASLRGAQVTRQLLGFSRRHVLEPQVFDLNRITAETMALLHRTLGEQVEIELELARDLRPALADPTQLESALANLAINARDAMPDGGLLTVTTANRRLGAAVTDGCADAEAGDYLLLEVADSGCGIAPEIMERVTEPFFTTKEQAQGTGLGLSMVCGFARQSGGQFRIDSEPGRGTRVQLYLPQAPMDAQLPSNEPLEAPESRPCQAKVLVVDDEAGVRRVATRLLSSLGYQVVEADGGKAALDWLAQEQPVDLLFTDMIMRGGLSGLELAREATRRRPALKVLFVSGFAEETSGNGEVAIGEVLRKPYRKAELERKLRQALAGRRPA